MTDEKQASSTAGLLVSLFCLLACKSENWDLGVKSICHWSLVTLEKFPTHWMVGISITLSEKQTNPMTIHQMQYLIICKTLLFLDPVNVRHPWYLLDVQGLYYGTKGWANLNTNFKLEKKITAEHCFIFSNVFCHTHASLISPRSEFLCASQHAKYLGFSSTAVLLLSKIERRPSMARYS